MIDREKVIKGLDCCIKQGEQGILDCDYDCPYGEHGNRLDCWIKMNRDAIDMLKEQEAVKPKYNARTNWYECGNCHYSMTSGMHCRSELIPATKVRYCANCGFPVNWEGR